MKQQFYLGQWQVDVTSNTLSLGKLKRTIEPKTMDVLLLLCQQKGEVVSSDEIVAQCWPRSVVVHNPEQSYYLRRKAYQHLNILKHQETRIPDCC